MKNTGAVMGDFDRQICPFAKFSLRNSLSSFCSAGRGGMSFLWGAWHHGGDLWHDPMLYKGGGGQRPPLRRHLQSPCIILGWCFWMVKMGRKPREGILHRLPCLVPRIRAMSEAQPKGSSNLSSRCAMNGLDEEVWLRSTGNLSHPSRFRDRL